LENKKDRLVSIFLFSGPKKHHQVLKLGGAEGVYKNIKLADDLCTYIRILGY
jgi:hypothetical protein